MWSLLLSFFSHPPLPRQPLCLLLAALPAYGWFCMLHWGGRRSISVIYAMASVAVTPAQSSPEGFYGDNTAEHGLVKVPSPPPVFVKSMG